MEILRMYASGWLRLWEVVVAFGIATELRYILMGLVVAVLAGYMEHLHVTRRKWRRLPRLCSVTALATLSFFAWPATLGIWAALGMVFAPILLVLLSLLLFFRLLLRVEEAKKIS